LEFPVVIFPFADMQLYDGKYDTLWYPLGNADFNFTEALINFKAEIANYGEVGARMYNEHRSRLELDNINLLYVTLTRAIEKLYVFAEMPTQPKEGGPSCYNHLFMEFLKHVGRWNSEQMVYEFGKNSDKISKGKESVPQREPLYFSSNPMAHGLKMVASEEIFMESETIAAITAGNLLHETMAKIFAAADAAKVLEELEKRSIIPAPEFEVLTKMVHQIIGHPELESLFNGSDVVYNEQSIITKNGALIRPDRINVSRERTVTIVDYKTGSPKNYHLQQLDLYEEAVMEMGFAVSEKILVYNNEEGLLINKV
jgi:ATP-dependent exoDNAse (exonuclease V) beta subunit